MIILLWLILTPNILAWENLHRLHIIKWKYDSSDTWYYLICRLSLKFSIWRNASSFYYHPKILYLKLWILKPLVSYLVYLVSAAAVNFLILLDTRNSSQIDKTNYWDGCRSPWWCRCHVNMVNKKLDDSLIMTWPGVTVSFNKNNSPGGGRAGHINIELCQVKLW